MNILTMIAIACALAMDTFAIAIASGAILKKDRLPRAVKMALFFGGFQMIMPVAGWYFGSGLHRFFSAFDHIVAFSLLAFVGTKMIYESFKIEEQERRADPFATSTLFMLAIATSIDALTVGLSFAFLKMPIVTPVIVIGVITFMLSLAGVFIGNRFGHFFERKIEVIGGLVLIGIGFKILIEHLWMR